ncbi:DUF192 domain-containing protein [Bordetella genomosp. 4]|uniref:DUF192 domain-containing protein n=1 Tax=Bordetella genomosp. 4 TaxID=463044 RepID=UPI000B9E88A1|nr:DUF192 domain-containing protein [Bordetella genomosp. 4]OZI48878.1 hypothetical protein CAL21_11640 [Bordetella genomosp. 4]
MSIHRFTWFARALSRLATGQYSFHLPLRSARTATTLAISALLTTASLAAAAQTPAGPQTGLPVTELTAGIHVIRAEVANTDETRRVGLMLRKSLPDNNGMLFVFEEPELQCFWMRNTLVPLSIAFIADDGTIVNMADMAPQTDDPHCSERPVRYALEMAQGWFETRGVAAGQRLGGISQ